MKATDLIEGKRYIIKRQGNPAAVFEGKHPGRLDLANGSVFYGGDNLLRFSLTAEDGSKQTLLLNSGADVDEPEDVRIERERLQAERQARTEAAFAEATQLLSGLGLEVVGSSREVRERANGVQLRRWTYDHKDSPDEIEIEDMTIGKLKLALGRAQPAQAVPV
jgi:hypothetical protein